MPSKKKKYNARFPAGRIKKIMQTDEEVGKVAQAVPVIISRTLELFVESLLTKAVQITTSRNAKTLSPSHMKQCILSESRFDFLKDLVKSLPDVSVNDEDGTHVDNSSTSTNRRPTYSMPVEPLLTPDPTPVSSMPSSQNKFNFYREVSVSESLPQVQPPITPLLGNCSTSVHIDEDYDT